MIRPVKISVCQECNGWVRVAALEYINSNTKARNEFLKEVIKHNLSVREMENDEWNKLNIHHCCCGNNKNQNI